MSSHPSQPRTPHEPRRWRRSRRRPASRGRPSPTRSTGPSCCARRPWRGCSEAIETLGYSPNRAARSLRTRSSQLVGLRVDPAVEDSANAMMDRFVHSLVESTEVAGYHVLLFTDGGDHQAMEPLRRAAAVGRRRRLRHHRHVPRQPARRLAEQPGRAVRRVRPAVGRAGSATPVGRRGQPRRRRAGGRPPRRARPLAHRVGRLAEGLVHRGGAAQRLGRPHARVRPVDEPALGTRRRHPGVRRAGGPRPARRRREGPADRVRVRERHGGHGGAACPRRASACEPAATSRWSASTTRIAAQVATPALTSVRQPLEEVAVEIVRYLGALLAHRPLPEPGLRAHADAERARHQLTVTSSPVRHHRLTA